MWTRSCIFSMKAGEIAFCNVVCANRYTEDWKTDLKKGCALEMLEYGEFVMSEGEVKQTATRTGVALSARFAETRETVFVKKEARLLRMEARLLWMEEHLSEETDLRLVSEV